MMNEIFYNGINLKGIIQRVLLPYQVTQLNEKEQSLLEITLQKLPQAEQAKIMGIADEIFLDEMPLDVKEGRWWYSVLYGIIEYLQEQDYQQAEQTARC